MKTINIIKHWGMGLMLCIGMVTLLNSCKDDDETLIDQFYEFPEIITCSLGDQIEIADMKFGDDTLVVPAVVMNLTYAIENKNIITTVNGELTAVGVGSTEIFIYNAQEELIKTIPVVVTFGVDFINPEDGIINLKYNEEIECIEKYNNENDLKYCQFISTDTGVVTVNDQGLIKAVGLGEAQIGVYINRHLNLVYDVTVSPNYEVTMNSGKVIGLQYLIDDLPNAYYLSGLSSSNPKVVNAVSYGYVTSLEEGVAIVGNSDVKVKITVINPLKSLFDLDAVQIGHYVRLSTVKNNMSVYLLTSERAATFNGVLYPTVLTYQPFDDATSIKFYFDRTNYLKFRVVETGKTSEEVCGWLANNANSTKLDQTGQFSYFRLVNGASYNYVYPVNGSWSTIQIEDYVR
ncbi:MAG: hypothetical protein K2M31_00100 [Muribaculaceae bacterium]|nr:hypothetical protein [Muribaculaceae bacterium]